MMHSLSYKSVEQSIKGYITQIIREITEVSLKQKI